MKKLLSVLIIAMLVLILSIGNVNAVTSYKMAFSVDNSASSVTQGGTVTVIFKLSNFAANETGITEFAGEFVYDRDIFETVKYSDFTMSNGWSALSSMSYNENEGVLSSSNPDFIAKDHEMFRVTLKIKDNAKLGSTTIQMVDVDSSDGFETIVPDDVSYPLTIRAAAATTPAPTPTPTAKATTTPTPTSTTKMPNTGVEDYILPTIGVIAVIAIFAYVRFNKMDK